MGKLVHNVQKKQHRERGQVTSRARFGLLEKKKDYKLRSENFHKNQAKLKLLKEKAKAHNDDEFYHAMTNRKTNEDGILIQKREFSENLTNDQVLLMKGQDLNYLNMISSKEAKKIEKGLNTSSLFASNGKHTVFVEDKNDFDNFQADQYFQTNKELLKRRENRLRTDQLLENELNISQDTEFLEDALAYKKKELDLLKQRIERERQLVDVKNKLQLQKELMKSGSKKKIIKDGKTVFKWKNQRKK
jgi:U3 small nucleolar RNA-associated protein 11